MHKLKTIDLILNQLSNEEVVDFINQIVPLKNEDLLYQIQEEFEIRQINYQHLLSREKQLQLTQPLRLIDGNLFELNIPKPPMIGTFYQKVRQLGNYLFQHPLLEGKHLVTFDYILDQFYLTTDTIRVISEDEIDQLTKDEVFIGFRNSTQTFPNQQIFDQIKNLEYYIIIDKGPFYRGLSKVEIYQKDTILDQWVID